MKKERLQNSVLLNQNLSLNLNNDRIEHIKRLVQEYLKNTITEISILNVAEASTVFKVFRDICLQYELEKKANKKDPTKADTSGVESKESIKSLRNSFTYLDTSKVRQNNSAY